MPSNQHRLRLIYRKNVLDEIVLPEKAAGDSVLIYRSPGERYGHGISFEAHGDCIRSTWRRRCDGAVARFTIYEVSFLKSCMEVFCTSGAVSGVFYLLVYMNVLRNCKLSGHLHVAVYMSSFVPCLLL